MCRINTHEKPFRQTAEMNLNGFLVRAAALILIGGVLLIAALRAEAFAAGNYASAERAFQAPGIKTQKTQKTQKNAAKRKTSAASPLAGTGVWPVNWSFISGFSPGTLVNYSTSGLSGTTPGGVPPAVSPAPAENAGYTNITRGGGLTATSATGGFNSSSWATGATLNTANNDYYEFTITPNACYRFSATVLNIGLERSSTGPQNAVLRSSLDNYAADIGSVVNVPTVAETFTFDLSGMSGLQNSAVPVTFRIYGYNASSGTATMRVTAAVLPAVTLGLEIDGTVISQQVVITNQPADQSVTYGQNASFLSAADSPSAAAQQWQISMDNGNTWSNIPGANAGVLNLTAPLVAQSGTKYRAEFTNACGTFYSRPATLTVSKAPATVNLANLTHVFDATPKNATATTAPPGLAVDFSYVGTGTTVYPASATPPTDAGTYNVGGAINDANYQGNSVQPLTISPAAQTIAFNPLANKTYGDPPFNVSATGGASGNPVTFSATGNCAVTTDGLVTLSAAGSCTITASQAGSLNYAAAAPVSQSFTIASSNSPVGAALPDLTTLTAVDLTVPLNVSSTTGYEIVAFTFVLNYDPLVLTNPSISQTGTMASGYSIIANAATPGTIIVSGTGSPLSGDGTLLNFNFDVVGIFNPSCSLITFGQHLSNPIFESNFDVNPAVSIQNGRLCVVNGTTVGTVTYANALGSPLPRAVPEVNLSAAGAISLAAVTDLSGRYALSGFGNSAYTVTPAKNGGINGAIASLDATRIQQHIVGLTTLTTNQLAAADVTGSASVTSLDAARIQQYVAGLIVAANLTGTWKFNPSNRSYTDLQLRADQGAQDYEAILMGDVTGNWTSSNSPNVRENAGGRSEDEFLTQVAITLPNNSVGMGTDFSFPVTVTDLTGLMIEACDFDILYDANVIQPQPVPFDSDGTLSGGWNIVPNVITPGRLRISASGILPASGSGVFIKLKFTAVGASGAVSPLSLSPFRFNEGSPTNSVAAGQIQILAPTSSNALISGKLQTLANDPVARATVVLTDSGGRIRAAVSNHFGRFSFADIAVGETYLLSVRSKHYYFTPQVVSVSGDINNLILIAQP